MRLVVEMPESEYKKVKEGRASVSMMRMAIRNGTPLPKGHGRLIDADALIDSLDCSDRDIYCKSVIEEDAPTIIEADKESEGKDAGSNWNR